MGKMERFIPSMNEWMALRKLWARSQTVLASALVPSLHARAAWTAKTFMLDYPKHRLHEVLGWVQFTLGIPESPSSKIGEVRSSKTAMAQDVKVYPEGETMISVEIEVGDIDDAAAWADEPTVRGYKTPIPGFESACA